MTGPLAAYADACRSEMRGRGYPALSTVNELRQLGRLSGWLAARGMSAADLSVERVDEFLAEKRAQSDPVARALLPTYRSLWKCPPRSEACCLDTNSFPSSEGYSAEARG
jgi:hypothetical protein